MNRRHLYFLKQKLIGVMFIVFTLVLLPFSDGDCGYMMITVPLALWLMFTKKMVLVKENFYEVKPRRKRL